MLGWIRPTCPCDPAAKAWVEHRLNWLTNEFPSTVFSGRQIVLPTSDFFPDAYDGSRKAVRAMLQRVCEYMGVAPELVHVEFIAPADRFWLVNKDGDVLPTAPAGTFQSRARRFLIRISESEIDNPMALVGTLAHELSHARLLGEERIQDNVFDNELLTDLTTVAFGLGIFLANAPRSWKSGLSRWPNSNLRKPEYMTSTMFGYALAHVAWWRGENKPVWAAHLNWSARAEFNHSLRFLLRTADSQFAPSQISDNVS